MRSRLHRRIIALLIVMVGVAQLATFGVVHLATERSVRAQLAEDLAVGERVWRRFHDTRGEQLLETALVLADDFGLRAAVASGDPATIRSAVGNHASRVGADAAFALDAGGRWLAGLDEEAWSQGAFASTLVQAEREGFALAVVPVDGVLYQLALIPVLAPQRIGWVGIGTTVDAGYADDFRSLTGLDASFARTDAKALRLYASSLDDNAREALAQLPPGSLPDGEALKDVALGAEHWFVRALPLAATGDASLRVLLQGSLDQAMAPYAALKTRILWLSGLAAALALLVAGFLGRGISRPVVQLAEAAQRVQAGDYTQPIEVKGQDEIARLAAAFGHMQQGIAAREQRILHQAHHDGLTGLPNRSLAHQRLDAALGEGRGAVLMVDLDRFKEINDTLGHGFGDQVLEEVGKRLRQAVRTEDVVARLGGDEFMVLMHDVDAHQAEHRARGLLDQLRQPLVLPTTRINLDASLGLALHPEHGRDAHTLLRRADIALYDAKQLRSGIAVYREGRDEVHLRQLALVGDLRESITREQLSLRFQPKVDLGSRQVRHVEALLRWRHHSLGAISPEEFIPLAERSGFVHELTRFVLDTSLAQNARWRAEGLDLGVAVNLSAMDLMDAELPEFVARCLREHGVPPQRLILEVTEGALMRDVEYAIRMLHRLRAGGVRLSIDDFGTGYSSLAQLKRMPVDELKIDKSFVMQMTEESDDAVIVRSTIELGHNMGLSVIAEGVETDVSLGLLQRYRCDMVQGYFFSPPLESGPLVAWCRKFSEEKA